MKDRHPGKGGNEQKGKQTGYRTDTPFEADVSDVEAEKPSKRGVVLVGRPGSGKTTIARELVKVLPDSVYCEASQIVIKPAIRLGLLPENAEQFISSALNSPDVPMSIDRDQGRETFTSLAVRYGKDIIARTLIAYHETKAKEKLLIVGGIRGKENVAYFKEHGYFIVFLNVAEETIIQRMMQGRGLSEEDARRDYSEEEKLYKHPASEKLH
jgi:cytidylate kinase